MAVDKSWRRFISSKEWEVTERETDREEKKKKKKRHTPKKKQKQQIERPKIIKGYSHHKSPHTMIRALCGASECVFVCV